MSDNAQAGNSKDKRPAAHGDDEGFKFILGGYGIERAEDAGHLVAIAGRGGTGKSIYTLQTVVQLLRDPLQCYPMEKWGAGTHDTVFYFSLEATPDELLKQLRSFTWYTNNFADEPERDPKSGIEIHCKGISGKSYCLRILSVPTPTLDIPSLTRLIEQRIADSLGDVRRLAAIVIDPLGGLTLDEGMQHDLGLLKELCYRHKVFLFLLVEDFVFSRFRSIEHFSQTIIHLQHDPSSPPFRLLHIQKARHQNFFPGFHQLEFDQNEGVKVYPSLRAQSRRAHEELKDLANHLEARSREAEEEPTQAEVPFFSRQTVLALGHDPIGRIPEGSVLFLMGPPGTFKQWVATGFALSSLPEDASTVEKHRALYLSFKADKRSVLETAESILKQAGDQHEQWKNLDVTTVIEFEDRRDPILSPEEVLFRIRGTIEDAAEQHNRKSRKNGEKHEDREGKDASTETPFKRAVIWGLRRLQDMPMFAKEGRSVQFLETLVTFLRARRITSLLVDWPDIATANKLPIVDLSQYILLTRLCRHKTAFNPQWSTSLWPEQPERAHVAMLQVQRMRGTFQRHKGSVLYREAGEQDPATRIEELGNFEELWIQAGIAWEQDPGLVERPVAGQDAK